MHDLIDALNQVSVPLIEAATKAQAEKAQRQNITNMSTRVAKLFSLHANKFLKTFARFEDENSQNISQAQFDDVFDESALTGDFQKLIDTFVEKGLTAGAKAVLGLFDSDIVFELENPRAVAYLREYAATQVKHIDETSKAQLREVLALGVEDGWSYNRLARGIKAKFNEFSAKRARNIAVYELGNAYQEGNMIAARDMQDTGLSIEKHWLTVGDDNVDEHCKANENEGYIPLNQAFSSGKQRPLDHNGCRCVLQFRRVKETSEATHANTISEANELAEPARSEAQQERTGASDTRSRRRHGRNV